MTRSGTMVVSLSRRLPYARTSAPVALASRAVPGAWSGCVWVSSTQRTRSFIDAPMMASMWRLSSGPGSITATSSMPTRYVLVPGPVNGPGLGATMRRTSGERGLGTPGVRSGTSRPFPDAERDRIGPHPHDEARRSIVDEVLVLGGEVELPTLAGVHDPQGARP